MAGAGQSRREIVAGTCFLTLRVGENRCSFPSSATRRSKKGAFMDPCHALMLWGTCRCFLGQGCSVSRRCFVQRQAPSCQQGDRGNCRAGYTGAPRSAAASHEAAGQGARAHGEGHRKHQGECPSVIRKGGRQGPLPSLTQHIALAIGEEVDLQTRLLDDLQDDVDVTNMRMKAATSRIKQIISNSSTWRVSVAWFHTGILQLTLLPCSRRAASSSLSSLSQSCCC